MTSPVTAFAVMGVAVCVCVASCWFFFFNWFPPCWREISLVLNTVIWCTQWEMKGRLSMESPWKHPFPIEVSLRRSQKTPLALGALLARLQAHLLPVRVWLKAEKEPGQWIPPACSCKGRHLCQFHNPLQGAPGSRKGGCMLVMTGSCNLHPGRWGTGVCEVELQWEKWECMDNALGGNVFLLTHAKKKKKILLLRPVSLCLGIHGILSKEDSALVEQKLLGVCMVREKGKSRLLTELKAK